MGEELFALWGGKEEGGRVNTMLLDYIKGKVGLEKDEIFWSGYAGIGDLQISSELEQLLSQSVAAENISFDPLTRLRHSIGMGGLDYIQLMEKKEIRVVDAVVYASEEEVRKLLSKDDERIEVIPYGGGTSVTRGLTPYGKRRYSVSIDLSRLNFMKIDPKAGILEAGTGLKGTQIEEALRGYNLTLGNFPESFQYSTLGGWIATNAAGQESNRYGKIKDMVIGLRMETPRGTFQDRIVPGESAFFKLADIAVGSEGAFGIVTRAWLRLHRKPDRLYYKAFMFGSFEDGLEALRAKFASGKIPIISRLSDEDETELSFIAAGEGTPASLFKKYVSFRMNKQRGSLLIAVSDGMEELNFEGGIKIGSMPSRYWYGERYSRPYIYNELLRRGIVAETIETSGNWDKLMAIHNSAKRGFAEKTESLGIKGLILSHSSHQYITGAALYFTFIFHAKDDRATYLQAIRDEITKRIISEGGSISHHHGVGRIQGPYLADYKGSMFDLLRAVKAYFDPRNSLTPGILGSDE